MSPSPPRCGLGPWRYSLSRPQRVHLCYGPVTRSLPKEDFVDRLQSFCFHHLCYPNYGALTSTPAGLSPAEHASLRWTHNRTCGFPCIRLSDKASRLRPRHVAPKPGQTHEPAGLVEVREWIAAALTSSGLVLEAQPPAQPHSRVAVERPIRRSDGAYGEVVRPSAKREVQHSHHLCGFLPPTCAAAQLVDLFDHALDALL